MTKNDKYYIDKKNKVKEMIFTKYSNDKLYLFSPKRQKSDELKVNNILITSPQMIEKIITRKIEIKLAKYVNAIKILNEEEDSTSSGTISQLLLDAERFRMKLINEYTRYLGHSYNNLTQEKMKIVINELREKLYHKQKQEIYSERYLETDKKGRGR